MPKSHSRLSCNWYLLLEHTMSTSNITIGVQPPAPSQWFNHSKQLWHACIPSIECAIKAFNHVWDELCLISAVQSILRYSYKKTYATMLLLYECPWCVPGVSKCTNSVTFWISVWQLTAVPLCSGKSVSNKIDSMYSSLEYLVKTALMGGTPVP